MRIILAECLYRIRYAYRAWMLAEIMRRHGFEMAVRVGCKHNWVSRYDDKSLWLR